MKYSEKLKDPRWQKKRLAIFERDGWKCVACDAKDKTLHVHHSSYHGEPWEAPDEELDTLCDYCHERITLVVQIFRQFDKRATCNWIPQKVIGVINSASDLMDHVVSAEPTTDREFYFAFHIVRLLEQIRSLENGTAFESIKKPHSQCAELLK